MTSKEALRILSECANGEKKLVFSDSLDLEQIINKDLERLEQENKNLKEDINLLCDTKYKPTWRSLMDERNNLRNLLWQNSDKGNALEILVKHCMIKLGKDEYSYWIESPIFNGNRMLITEDEYELLEENIKDETK